MKELNIIVIGDGQGGWQIVSGQTVLTTIAGSHRTAIFARDSIVEAHRASGGKHV